MKTEATFRTILGITQQEMASLLCVSRGQFSMFELGKRDLPLPAMNLLTEFLAYIKASEPSTGKSMPDNAMFKTAMQTQIERLLLDNEYKQMLVNKKIIAATKKNNVNLRMVQLADFLKNRPISHLNKGFVMSRSNDEKAMETYEKGILNMMLKHELKLEMLTMEKLLLESKLQKLNI